MRGSILRLIAIAASLATARADASCIVQYETVIRGRLLRCERTQFYWDASGANRLIQNDLDRALSGADPTAREQLTERLRQQQLLPGSRNPQSMFVAVVLVDWQGSTIAAWQPDATEVVEMRGRPQEFHEVVRYLWRGPAEACENAAPQSSVDLWVTRPCCDTSPLLSDDGCLLEMNYAEPAPRPLRDALSKALEGL
jgi:hypothetical protein